MRFEVVRTSGRGWDTSPCKEAVPAHFPSWDVRTLPSPEAFDARFPQTPPWLSEGTEHRTTAQGYIARRWPNRPGWAVDFESLDDLLAFVVRYGEVVISPERAELGETPRVEIYDDYRE